MAQKMTKMTKNGPKNYQNGQKWLKEFSLGWISPQNEYGPTSWYYDDDGEKKNDNDDGFNNRLNDSHLRSNIGTARPHKSLPGDVVVGQLTVVPYHDLSKEDISF